MEHLFKLLPDINKTVEIQLGSQENISVENHTTTWLFLCLKSIFGEDESYPIKSGEIIKKSIYSFGTAWLEYGDIEKEIDVNATLI